MIGLVGGETHGPHAWCNPGVPSSRASIFLFGKFERVRLFPPAWPAPDERAELGPCAVPSSVLLPRVVKLGGVAQGNALGARSQYQAAARSVARAVAPNGTVRGSAQAWAV